MVVSIKVYKGDKYPTKRARTADSFVFWNGLEQLYSDEYIRIEYDTGYLDMQKYYWDKLSKKAKDHIIASIRSR